ncbi:unnamed protein product [Linum trigynum]|uniref:Reverse transcriptase n=1 Tax=Linum trigynum TaxID=586398 RepID=A0AAV2EYG4_9ROSI
MGANLRAFLQEGDFAKKAHCHRTCSHCVLEWSSNRREICSRLGIHEIDDLGRYLGVPVLHGRTIKKLTTDRSCKACNGRSEMIEHILRQCRKTEGFRNFFKIEQSPHDTRSFKQWMKKNLKDAHRGTDFGITCWMIWMGKSTQRQGSLAKSFPRFGCTNKQGLMRKGALFFQETSTLQHPSLGNHLERFQIQTDRSVLQNSGNATAWDFFETTSEDIFMHSPVTWGVVLSPWLSSKDQKLGCKGRGTRDFARWS